MKNFVYLGKIVQCSYAVNVGAGLWFCFAKHNYKLPVNLRDRNMKKMGLQISVSLKMGLQAVYT